tara:strand:+ start:819 stop:1829 length:1011 start_codon:yes stop_codon:yes gene_type:complete
MDRTIVKKELDKLVAEAAISGEKVTKKAQGTSKTQNKAYYKDVETKMSDYDKNLKKDGEDAIDPKKFPAEDKEKEYHDDMEIMNGQEMIEYDREPNDTFKDRAKKAIEGDSTMGNKTYTGKDNGNTEPVWGASDAKFGEKLVKTANASAKKRADAITPTTSMGDDIEIDTRKGERVKAKKIATEGMKRLRFKTPFNGVGNALKLIPEGFRVNNKKFEMTDGQESYKMKWVGSLSEGRAVILEADSAELVKEDYSKIKHLMGYKSETTLGSLDGNARISENEVMKTRVNLLHESIGDVKGSEVTEGKECKCDKCDCVMTEEAYTKSSLCEVCIKEGY